MHRIVKRIATLCASVLVVGASVSACATEEPTFDYDQKTFQNGGCVADWCPDTGGVGTKCCVPGINVCGVNQGMGCIPRTSDAGS
jgi:hypothetical protein